MWYKPVRQDAAYTTTGYTDLVHKLNESDHVGYTTLRWAWKSRLTIKLSSYQLFKSPKIYV
ncbi:hypothetical protein GCM10028819_45150 [Spirosoma humi]